MSTITTLNQQALKIIQTAILNQAEEALDKLGITAEFSGGTFAPHEATLKIKIKTDAAAEINAKEAQAEWEMYHQMYQLPKDGIGKVINLQGTEILLTGLKPRSPKNKVVGKYLDGRGMCVMPLATARHALANL